jgi:ABC-2 type transport system permease protein
VSGLIGAEIRKLWSIRTTWVLTAFGLVLVGLQTAFLLFESELTGRFTGTEGEVAALADQPGAASFMVLVVALLAITNEFRHGTIGRSLQVEPSRTRLLVAKLTVAALYGLVFFVAGLLLVAALLGLAVAIEGVTPEFGDQLVTSLWQGPVGLVLTAVLGVAVGALLRSQVLAVTISLVWIFLVENLILSLAPQVARWLPFQALQAVFVSEETMRNVPEGFMNPLDPLVGLSLFLGYVVAFTVFAGVLLRTRDV